MDINNIYNLLYPNYQEILVEIETLYPKDSGYYVFRRKKLDSHHYNTYLKANKGDANIETLTYPAFPKYLLPPKTIFEELEKSPKLSLKDGFRKYNWNDVIGEYIGDVKNLVVNTNKYLTSIEKVIRYLNLQHNKNDMYIYSIYLIDKICELKYFCCHIGDITQKKDNSYSLKSDKYTQNLQPYTFQFNIIDNNIISEYGKL